MWAYTYKDDAICCGILSIYGAMAKVLSSLLIDGEGLVWHKHSFLTDCSWPGPRVAPHGKSVVLIANYGLGLMWRHMAKLFLFTAK